MKIINCFSLVMLLVAMLTGSCSRWSNSGEEEPLAKVGNVYLYPADLKGLIKPGISKEDSISMVASLVEKWVRKQVILQKAEMNLTNEEKDVNKELDEYRTSLLIYKYEQKYISEKLDTVVKQTEIEEYYNQNPSNFTLSSEIVKAQFVKLPLTAPNTEKLKEWMRSENSENIKLIEGYCFQYATKYDYFNDEWVSFNTVRSLMPNSISDNENFLKTTKFAEMKDSANYYFLSIKDYKLKGSISPLKFVQNDIYNIILLKRKQKLVNELENKLYFEAK